ncbi:MAG: GerMN domain-containing protein [Lachnospiraceae bacterium]
MKKRVVLILCCSVLLSITGCEKSEESDAQNSSKPSQIEAQNNEEDKTSKTEENVLQEEHNQSGDEETEMEAVAQKKEVTIYKIDQESGELITEVKECEELNERIIWKYLVEAKVVPEDSEALSMVKDGEQLQLDVNRSFGEWLRSFGTAGEQEIMSCVVNTYLDAYGAQSIKITEEGQILNSGHMSYEEYMEKY